MKKIYLKQIVMSIFFCFVVLFQSHTVFAVSNPYVHTYYNNSGKLCYNCTWYAWQRAYEKVGVALPGFTGNAKGWYQGAINAGYNVGSEPRANSIIVWTDSAYGHVGFVEEVNGNNVTISEAGTNYGASSYACNTYDKNYLKTRWKQTLLGYIYLQGTSQESSVSFQNWEKDSYTYINETDASIGQNIIVSGGSWTRVGMILYDVNENKLGEAGDTPDGNTKYYYKINQELGVTLSPSTTYKYKFFAVVNGQTYYSELKSFITKGNNSNNGENSNKNIFGIDVSEHQGNIDWNAVAGQVDFVIIRCGFGSDLKENDDKKWLENVNECERLGMPYGVYIYSYAENNYEASSEAEHVLRLLKGHSPKLPVYYDLENNNTVGKLSNEQILNQTKVFCSKIRNAGYDVGVYASLNWWNTKLNSNEYNNYKKWVAAYGGDASVCQKYTMWQYSSSGSISGINGNVDVNYCYEAINKFFVKGDANLDNKLDLQDVLLILKAALGINELQEQAFTNSDLNYDKIISLEDTVIALKLSLGIL